MVKPSRSHHCAAINCHNNQAKFKDISYFRFPKEAERSRRWVVNTRREDLLNKSTDYLYSNCTLCSKHFEPSMFMNIEQKNKLIWNAIPTIFEIPNPPKVIQNKRRELKRTHIDPLDEARPRHLKKLKPEQIHNSPDFVASVNEIDAGPSNNYTPKIIDKSRPSKVNMKINKLKEIIKSQKRKMSKYETIIKKLKAKPAEDKITKVQIINFIETHCTGFQKVFLMAQVTAIGKGRQGRRWTNDMKYLALAFYFQSPKHYRFLCTILSLPSKSTLWRWTSTISTPTGFSSDLFKLLQEKVGAMPIDAREVVLCIDEMSLKAELAYHTRSDRVIGFESCGETGSNKIANSVTVFLVRGIKYKFKQPIGYAFCNEAMPGSDVKNTMMAFIDHLETIGLQVILVITDQGSNFQKLIKLLEISVDKPYFSVNGRTCYFMFDPPHLFKSVRNNLNKYNINCSGSIASWKDIQQFYDLDSKQQYRAAPKLTPKHLQLPPFSKMSVSLAAQVLSHSVEAGILGLVSLGNMPGSSIGTANFIGKFDMLFDCFNSCHVKSTKKYKAALSDKSQHITFLTEMKNWLANITFLNRYNGSEVKVHVKCFEGWRLTISALLMLWQQLKLKSNFSFLLTRRLNQDALENYFSAIRQRGGFNDNPSPAQFQNIFKITCLNIMIETSTGRNCEPDSDEFFLSLSKLCTRIPSRDTILPPTATSSVVSASDDFQVLNTDHLLYSIPEENAFLYVCGYLLKRLYEKHDCEYCKSLQELDPTMDTSNKLLLTFKAYEHMTNDFHNLIVATDKFCTFIKHCEIEFQSEVSQSLHISCIRARIVQNIQKNVTFPVTCSYFEKFITNLFVRVRLYYTIKFGNRDLKSMPRKQRKIVKVKHL